MCVYYAVVFLLFSSYLAFIGLKLQRQDLPPWCFQKRRDCRWCSRSPAPRWGRCLGRTECLETTNLKLNLFSLIMAFLVGCQFGKFPIRWLRCFGKCYFDFLLVNSYRWSNAKQPSLLLTHWVTSSAVYGWTKMSHFTQDKTVKP